jgi:hypothetical protein
MRRVLPDKRGVAGLASCGHQPGTLERPPQAERQQEWAGTPVGQSRLVRERQTPGGRKEHPPQCPSRHRHRFLFIGSRIAIVRPA